MDPLLDRDCVILDGACDCKRLEGHTLPECKRYETSSNNTDNTRTADDKSRGN